MGAAGAHHQSQPAQDHQLQDSFSFGIAGYKEVVGGAGVIGGLATSSSSHGSSGGGVGVKDITTAATSSHANAGGTGHHQIAHHAAAGGPAVGGTCAVLAAAASGGGVKDSGSSTVGGYPSPHYSGNTTDSSPLSRLKQSIEDAGVGPMTPLGQEVSLSLLFFIHLILFLRGNY